jgi:hypothetical protein
MSTIASLEIEIAAREAKAEAFVAKRHNNLNAAQTASLAKLNAGTEKLRAKLEALRGESPVIVPPAGIVDVGAEPLPNNNRGQTEGQSYDCPDDRAKFEADHGYTLEWAFNDQLTKLLRPTEDTPDAATRQAAALRFVRGEAPFEEYASFIGGNAKYLGCIVIADIHDLGA